MFFTSQPNSSPEGEAVYRLNGHEFGPTSSANEVTCRKCLERRELLDVLMALSLNEPDTLLLCPGSEPILAVDPCARCRRELSRSYLDFYTGFDPIERDLCRDCRSLYSARMKKAFNLVPA